MMDDNLRDKRIIDMVAPGIPDPLFERGDVPMTKEEIRVLTIAKLRLTPAAKVLDVGAGTGSITVECARILPQGMVYAVEREPKALELLSKNCRKFSADNVQIIAGEAPDCLGGLPAMDAAVIGGSGGHLRKIIERVRDLLNPGGRIVINGILLETVNEAMSVLEEDGFAETGLIQAQISRGMKLGGRTALQPLNPVFILWGTRKG